MERFWQRHHGHVSLTVNDAQGFVAAVLPGANVLSAMPLSGGLRNTNVRLDLRGGPSPLVLRLYTANPAACAREAAVLGALPALVPAPRVVHAEPAGDPPWALLSWLDGGALDRALGRVKPDEALMLAGDCGASLAAIHAIRFPRSGFLGPELALGEPLGTWSGVLDSLLRGAAGVRLGADRTPALAAFVARHWPEMDPLLAGEGVLCHGDYKPWNLLARISSGVVRLPRFPGLMRWGLPTGPPPYVGGDRPRLAGIVDWEFAFAGSPLFDVGTFLRDEARLPEGFADSFAAGYRRLGGELPADWRRLARRLDLINLCQLVERGDERTLADLRPLIDATLALD